MTEETPKETRKRILIGAVLWLLCLQFFVAEQIAAHAFYPPYSFLYQLISDLGSTRCGMEVLPPTCSPHHVYLNLSLALQGLLIAVGVLGVRRSFNARFGFHAATTLLLLSGVFVFWMGATPLNLAHQLHMAVSNLYLLCGGAAILLFGGMMFTEPAERPILGLVSLLAGVPIFVAAVLMATNAAPIWERVGLSQGIVQRVSAYGIPLWLAMMGIALLGTRGRVAPPLRGIYLPPPPPPRMKADS